MGLAEDVLGTALAGESVTVATKVGIARPPHPGMKGVARALLSPVLTYFPSVKARLVGKVVQSVSRGQFGLEQVEASFPRACVDCDVIGLMRCCCTRRRRARLP
jgi:hypothetical protein